MVILLIVGTGTSRNGEDPGRFAQISKIRVTRTCRFAGLQSAGRTCRFAQITGRTCRFAQMGESADSPILQIFCTFVQILTRFADFAYLTI